VDSTPDRLRFHSWHGGRPPLRRAQPLCHEFDFDVRNQQQRGQP
jgi:hypothetical protein